MSFTDHLIIDGRHLLWRTADAFRDLSAEVDGEETGTGGIYGFLTLSSKAHAKYRGKVSVCWEGVTNFRHELFPGYKRKDTKGKTPEEIEESASKREDLERQERLLIGILGAVGVHQFRGIDHEADDVIGTLAVAAANRGESVTIYSGDSDLRQLVRPLIFIAAPVTQGKGRGRDKIYATAADVKEKHFVSPKRLAQLKALAGDTSDKIPGVPGVGDKTAAALLHKHGSLGKVLRSALAGDPEFGATERIRKLVVTHAKDVLLYYKLTQIRTTAEMFPLVGERSQKKVTELFKRYRFRSLTGAAELHAIMRMGEI